MGQPIWQIRPQNLGTIAENIFFEYELEAIDTDTQPVTYSLIAGTLPDGIQLTGTAISGIPIKITGVPADVDVDTSSRFSIRATTTTNEVSDITLDLTVSGQTAPDITTVPGLLGTFSYGDFINLQLDAIDLDVSNTLTWGVINNTLPAGLELIVDETNDRIAYIRGYPVPATALPPGIFPGFDGQKFDEDLGEFGFDFGLNTVNKTFEFIISVTDGIGFDSATFSILLESTNIFYTADNNAAGVDPKPVGLYADSGLITADIVNVDTKINPILTTDPQDLGTVLHDNYFTFLFEGLDFEGDLINFRESTLFSADSNTISADTIKQTADTTVVRSLPQSLVLDATTGYLYGFLDIITTTSTTFTFDIVAFKVANPTFISDPVTFTMTVVSDLANSLVINSPLIMQIDNGKISELVINAEANSDSDFSVLGDTSTITVDSLFPTVDSDTNAGTLAIQLEYSLVEGSGNLPIGLALTSTGLIIGRTFFTHNSWDMGTTIFDSGDTLYNATYTFDVRIVDVTLGVIDQVQTFSIIVQPINITPFENLYLVSAPTIAERAIYQALIDNVTIIPRVNLYRELDAYFGIAKDLRFLLADGLAPGTQIQYSDILEKNHYTRRFSFSKLKIAKAVDSVGAPSYELIYADVVDSLENNNVSIAAELIVAGVDEVDLSQRGADPQYIANTIDDIFSDSTTVTSDDNTITADGTIITTGTIIIRPASIVNMRETVISGAYALTADNLDQDAFSADDNTFTADTTEISGLGQLNLNTLPDWMTTTQDDGRVFGFIPAIPLVYCLPTAASQILFDINQSGFNLNEISFDVDRYYWDNNLTKTIGDFFFTLSNDETNFNGVDPNGSFVGGIAWQINDQIILTNRAILLVEAVDASGAVTEFTITTIGGAIQSNIEMSGSFTADNDIITSDNSVITADVSNRSNFSTADNDIITSDNSVITADIIDTALGTGFMITPIRPADEPDTGDELLKFPKTNVFQ